MFKTGDRGRKTINFTQRNSEPSSRLNQDQLYKLPVPSSTIVTRNVDRSDCIPEGSNEAFRSKSAIYSPN